jgi:hypothetical protein
MFTSERPAVTEWSPAGVTVTLGTIGREPDMRRVGSCIKGRLVTAHACFWRNTGSKALGVTRCTRGGGVLVFERKPVVSNTVGRFPSRGHMTTAARGREDPHVLRVGGSGIVRRVAGVASGILADRRIVNVDLEWRPLVCAVAINTGVWKQARMFWFGGRSVIRSVTSITHRSLANLGLVNIDF